jgi:hypothetical protein
VRGPSYSRIFQRWNRPPNRLKSEKEAVAMCTLIKVDFKARARLDTPILPKDVGTIDVIRSAGGKVTLDGCVPVEVADAMGAVATLPGLVFRHVDCGRTLFEARMLPAVADKMLGNAARSGVRIRGWRKAG